MSAFVKIVLGIAIAVIFPLMVGLGIEAFYSSPENPFDKCRPLDPNAGIKEPVSVYKDPLTDPAYKKCNDDQQKIVNVYNRNLFIIAIIIGFAAMTAGTLLISEAMGPVSPGLILGGLFTILYASGRSFNAIDKRWLFLIITIVFGGLIYITSRYLKLKVKSEK